MNIKKILLSLLFITSGYSFNAYALVIASSAPFSGKVFESPSHIAQMISGVCLAYKGNYHLSRSITQYVGRVSSLGNEYSDSSCTKLRNSSEFLNQTIDLALSHITESSW